MARPTPSHKCSDKCSKGLYRVGGGMPSASRTPALVYRRRGLGLVDRAKARAGTLAGEAA